MPYTPHPHHRSAAYARKKSQWAIALTEELNTYTVAVAKNWQCSRGYYWGLHLVNTLPTVLGHSPAPEADPLKIAKFVGDAAQNWHGYPVAHWKRPWDKPDGLVLQAWRADGLINKATMSKIHHSKKCEL